MINPSFQQDDPQTGAESPPAQTDTPEESSTQPNGNAFLAGEEAALMRKERDDLKDQLLRSRAEFANYQKRAKQQAEAEKIYAIGDLARDLLEAIDNLERATEALRASTSESISSGLEMVQKQLLATLAKYGVEPIKALEQPFDPNFHDALLQQPSAEHPEGTVVAELGKGYKIHDRVLRPSKVAVSVKP
ncbi:MAG: nucleotide exchange factor GrpE [Isosphaeraceae bacterium]